MSASKLSLAASCSGVGFASKSITYLTPIAIARRSAQSVIAVVGESWLIDHAAD